MAGQFYRCKAASCFFKQNDIPNAGTAPVRAGEINKLRKEILESETFENYAKENLILVRADFPRNKKNELPADQVKRNEALADQYNPNGIFPYTLLIDKNGKVIRSWNGYSNETPDAFVQIKDAYTK